MENYKEQYKNKGKKNWNWNVYVLAFMLVTRDTAQFETSLLNTDAPENAVQIIKNNNTTTEKKRQRTNTKRRELEKILAAYSLLL